MSQCLRVAAFLLIALFVGSSCAWSAPVAANLPSEYFVYFGTYTGAAYISYDMLWHGKSSSKGVYVSRFRPATGEVSKPELAAEITNPAFLAVHPNGRFLYVLTEDPLTLGPNYDHESFVSAFAIDPSTGKLHLLNVMPTGGSSTCYLSIDKTGRYVLMANFGSSSVTVLRIHDDGTIGEETAFVKHLGHGKEALVQSKAHPHSIDVSPDNRFAAVSDLGIDKVFVYRFDAATGKLSPEDAPSVDVIPGGGPRHFTFDDSGKFGYSISEMSGILTAFAFDSAAGTLTRLQDVQTLANDFIGANDSAEIQIHPNGRFLYESNRRNRGPQMLGPDTIGVFAIDPQKGTLTEVEQAPTIGHTPRGFAIDPTGGYLFQAGQVTGNVALFKIDAATGRLSPTSTNLKVEVPVCIKFAPVHP